MLEPSLWAKETSSSWKKTKQVELSAHLFSCCEGWELGGRRGPRGETVYLWDICQLFTRTNTSDIHPSRLTSLPAPSLYLLSGVMPKKAPLPASIKSINTPQFLLHRSVTYVRLRVISDISLSSMGCSTYVDTGQVKVYAQPHSPDPVIKLLAWIASLCALLYLKMIPACGQLPSTVGRSFLRMKYLLAVDLCQNYVGFVA